MTNALAGMGTLIERSDGNPTTPTWTPIGEVVNIGGLQLSADTADVTSHDSDAIGGWEEVIATVLRTGTISLEINFDPDGPTHQMVIKDLANKRLAEWRITFPDTTEWSFDALVTAFEPSMPSGDKLSGSVTLKPTGQPTLDVSNATL